ncbi:MAG: hypothetical protein HKO89_08770 [Saprospiraceae bacterium]|nr:hypothetical protein [Saprospiraceae bacterium]
MRHLQFLFLSLLLAGSLTSASLSDSTSIKTPSETDKIIEHYLDEIDFVNMEDAATIFTDLLISENGDLYNIDFMVTGKDTVLILSKEYEEEYYRVGEYSARNTRKYSVPVSYILI